MKTTTRECRERAIREAGHNTFLLRSEDVYIDLLTDSGTNAMSQDQWADMMLGDEAYAGSANYYRLEAAVGKHYGYPYLVPTHQGRGAEHLISQVWISEGDHIPGNMYFTTTREHQERAGGTFVDVIVDEAHDPESGHPFKGDVDLKKLKDLIERAGADRIPYVSVAATVNMAGGQPISMQNLREVRELTREHGIKVVLDATRAAENAYFVKQREQGYADRSITEILREMCSLSDAATVSAKKDLITNIGGFLATFDEELFKEARNLVVVYEGLHTYGGLAGRDMEAMARGIEEIVEEDYLHSRIGQVEYVGEKLMEANVPIVRPIGGHAIYLDARRFFPEMPQDQFPAQTLAAEIYTDSGLRPAETTPRSMVRNKETGEHNYPRLELLRLTFPRRVYTQAHCDVTVESVVSVHEDRESVRGLKMVYEPQYLRFFQARFERL